MKTIAARTWKEDPIYSPRYHNTGFIYAAVGDIVLEGCRGRPDIYEPLENAEAFWKTMPEDVLTGDLGAWRGFIRMQTAGWVDAKDVMMDVYAEARERGTAFICGESKDSAVQRLHAAKRDVVGALGNKHRADITVLTVGASNSLLIDFEKQLRHTAWAIGHITLTHDEVRPAAYNQLPVLFGIGAGFFISPPLSSFEGHRN